MRSFEAHWLRRVGVRQRPRRNPLLKSSRATPATSKTCAISWSCAKHSEEASCRKHPVRANSVSSTTNRLASMAHETIDRVAPQASRAELEMRAAVARAADGRSACRRTLSRQRGSICVRCAPMSSVTRSRHRVSRSGPAYCWAFCFCAARDAPGGAPAAISGVTLSPVSRLRATPASRWRIARRDAPTHWGPPAI
jgi:hypothetical protein